MFITVLYVHVTACIQSFLGIAMLCKSLGKKKKTHSKICMYENMFAHTAAVMWLYNDLMLILTYY